MNDSTAWKARIETAQATAKNAEEIIGAFRSPSWGTHA
jgi:hypothetical protein